jgi:hypothetical protein
VCSRVRRVRGSGDVGRVLLVRTAPGLRACYLPYNLARCWELKACPVRRKKQQVEFKTEMAHAQLSVGHPNAPTPEVVAVNGRSVEEQPPAAAAPYMPSVPAVPEGP